MRDSASGLRGMLLPRTLVNSYLAGRRNKSQGPEKFRVPWLRALFVGFFDSSARVALAVLLGDVAPRLRGAVLAAAAGLLALCSHFHLLDAR